MFSGPIYYNRRSSATHTCCHHSGGSKVSDHESHRAGDPLTDEQDRLSSHYSMKYGWSIIDDVKISTFIGHTLSGSRRGTICVNTAEPRTMLFEGRRFGIGPEDFVRVVVGRFDDSAADYLPAALSRTRYSDRRSTIINVPSSTETADLCRIYTWAKLSIGNCYYQEEEEERKRAKEEDKRDVSEEAAEVADEIFEAASKWLSSWFEHPDDHVSSPMAASSTTTSTDDTSSLSSDTKVDGRSSRRTASGASNASTVATAALVTEGSHAGSPVGSSAAVAVPPMVPKGLTRSATGELKNLMDTLTDIPILDVTPRMEGSEGETRAFPSLMLEDWSPRMCLEDAPIVASESERVAAFGDAEEASVQQKDERVLPTIVINNTAEASTPKNDKVMEEQAESSPSESSTKSASVGDSKSRRSRPREDMGVLALRTGQTTHMGLALFR